MHRFSCRSTASIFDPYVKLLLTPFSDIRIAERVVVITDGDRGALGDGEKTPGESRKEGLAKIASDLNASAALMVFINTYSLESELLRGGQHGPAEGGLPQDPPQVSRQVGCCHCQGRKRASCRNPEIV